MGCGMLPSRAMIGHVFAATPNAQHAGPSLLGYPRVVHRGGGAGRGRRVRGGPASVADQPGRPTARVPRAGLAPGRPATGDRLQPGNHPPGAAPGGARGGQHQPAQGRRPRPPDQRGYGARKPYVVADRLGDLHGPTAGTVDLPAHLDWSGDARYDLDKPARLASLYRTVLNEAGSVEDLREWLDARVLVEALAQPLVAGAAATALGKPVSRAQRGRRLAMDPFHQTLARIGLDAANGTDSRSPAATRCRRRAFCSGPARMSTCSRCGSAGASSRRPSARSSRRTGPPG